MTDRDALRDRLADVIRVKSGGVTRATMLADAVLADLAPELAVARDYIRMRTSDGSLSTVMLSDERRDALLAWEPDRLHAERRIHS